MEGLLLAIQGLYFLIECLFLLLNPALVALKFGASFPYLPFLLVAFSNKLIFRLYQDFFFLRFGLFDRVPFNPLRLLFGGGELESGIKPADRPSKNRTSKKKGSNTIVLAWSLLLLHGCRFRLYGRGLILSRIRTKSLLATIID